MFDKRNVRPSYTIVDQKCKHLFKWLVYAKNMAKIVEKIEKQ